MSPIQPTKVLIKQHLPAAVAALIVVFGSAVYIELLAWRILSPGLSLSDAWNQTFVLGALLTAAGSALLGMLPLVIGLMPLRSRPWAISHPVLLWSTGAGTFLLAMFALVMWAP